MDIFTDLDTQVGTLRALIGAGNAPVSLTDAIAHLSDAQLVAVITTTSAAMRDLEAMRIAAAGVASVRSTRDHGHNGLSQTRGHRSPTALIQDLTGSTRSEAVRQIRLGEALLAGIAPADRMPGAEGSGDPGDRMQGADTSADLAAPQTDGPAGAAASRSCGPWHAPLGAALLAGALTSAQHDAILRGLGGVDGVPMTTAAQVVAAGAVAADADARDLQCALDAAHAESRAAWAAAATQLIDEAAQRTVEELGAQARAIRDVLDRHGAQARFDDRFARRTFRLWTDSDGVRRGSICFDDEGGLWAQSVLASALRPRRGVRFVDPHEKAHAQQLCDDPRTNDQLAYDLLVDLLRAGALADAETVFGTRQAGIRLVITADAATALDDGMPAVGVGEDDGSTVPAWVVARHACDTAVSDCTIDRDGNPLYLGREVRLFSAKQKLALAIRDGGCRWTGCDRPASYCEAHHIDHWSRDGGKTDVDRGILLCRFHHMQLHHGDWAITRARLGEFQLRPPGGGPAVTLAPRLARRYLWAGSPPPLRFPRVARAA